MEYPVTAKVTDVTVYPDRARVVGSGDCTLEAGIHTIVVGDLPLAMDTDSVRAQGSGKANVVLRSVDVTLRNYVTTPSERVQELERELETREDTLQAIKDNRAGAEAMLAHLQGMRNETEQYARGLAKGQMSPETQVRLLETIQVQDQEARGRIRELDHEARELMREIKKLTAELEQLRSARPRQRYEARLDVEVLKAGTFTAEVGFVVNDAGWQPLYDMRFWQPEGDKPGEAALKVTYLAQVWQNTGSAWEDVRLAVSTARPALNQEIPELRPWFVDEYRPPQPRPMAKSARANLPDLAMMAAPSAPMAEMAEPQMDYAMAAQVAVAEVRDEGATVTFVVGGGVDVPSDGTPQKTVIGHFDLTPEIDYFSAPRHTGAVYRRATVVNTGPGPLLPGQINLFAGDEFIGSNSLEYTPVNGELELVLGVEERIEIKRELVRRDVDKRLLRDIRKIEFGYEIELHNGLATAAKMVIQDQIPNSRHEQIKVKLDVASPSPTSQTELNILEWELTLAPAAEKTIQYNYSVEHPRNMKVSGLLD